MSDVGEYIKKILFEKNMTQRSLAKASGLSTTTICRIIAGERGHRPSYQVIDKLAHGLGVSMLELSEKFGLQTPVYRLNQLPDKDINNILKNTKILLNQENLLFDGKPASEECIQSILDAMSIGMEIARKRNRNED